MCEVKMEEEKILSVAVLSVGSECLTITCLNGEPIISDHFDLIKLLFNISFLAVSLIWNWQQGSMDLVQDRRPVGPWLTVKTQEKYKNLEHNNN